MLVWQPEVRPQAKPSLSLSLFDSLFLLLFLFSQFVRVYVESHKIRNRSRMHKKRKHGSKYQLPHSRTRDDADVDDDDDE